MSKPKPQKLELTWIEQKAIDFWFFSYLANGMNFIKSPLHQ